MSDTPLSEAAGDKVMVPMTEKHRNILAWIVERGCDELTRGDVSKLREILANLRSQVEGMKLYDPREIEALEMDRRMLAVWKTYNPAPGTIAKHAIVTDTCRANRTDEGAAREATERLVAEFLECAPAWENMGAQFHFTLTLQRPSNGATGIRTTQEQAGRLLSPSHGYDGGRQVTSPLSKEQARELVDVFGNRYAEYLAARQYSPEGYEAKLEAINCTDARDALLAAIDSLIEALAEARVIISGKTFYCAGCEADALEKKPAVSDSPLDIAAIRARCEAATEEPWTLVEDSAGENTIRARGKIIAGVIATVRVRWVHEVQRIQQAANARFLASARSDIPALCDALSTAIAERDEAMVPGFDHNDALQILCRAFDEWEPIYDEWLDWYKPTDWLHMSRGFGGFMRKTMIARTKDDELKELQASVAARYEYIAKQTDRIASLESELSTSQERVRELEAVRRAALALMSWLYSPGAIANQLLEGIAEVSGVHASNIVALGEAFGMTQGEWPDEDKWLTRSDSLSPDTQRETT